jgi:hypothetical protein
MKTACENWKFPSVTMIRKFRCVLQSNFVSVTEIQRHVFGTVHGFVCKLFISVLLILLIHVMPSLYFTHCSGIARGMMGAISLGPLVTKTDISNSLK